jgi:hypothetical protein
VNQHERQGFDRAAAAAACVAAQVLYDQYKPGAPPFAAIAEIAQRFHDSTRRALQALGEADVEAHLIRAVDHWQTSVVTELERLHRAGVRH